ncbi:MAG: putative zinc-binding protein [Methanotrichaceae archaeon]
MLYVGQIANKATIDLSEEFPRSKSACLAGTGGHVGSLIESAKAAESIVAIDERPVRRGFTLMILSRPTRTHIRNTWRRRPPPRL